MNKEKNGFSLVEIATVIMVIALLAAAVMAGKSLVKGFRIRSLISQLHEVETATRTFKDRYNAIPGDFADAQTVWGSIACPSSSPTCPGNGNGLVSAFAGNNQGREVYVFFMHLSLAGLTNVKYNGYSLPNTSFKDVYMSPFTVTLYPSLPYYRSGSAMAFGMLDPTLKVSRINAFTSQDVYAVDVKIDDGVAYTGKVLGSYSAGDVPYSASTSGCPKSPTVLDYNLQSNLITCIIYYWMFDDL